MDLYRALLKPRGAHVFNWGSDALFGSLCWAYRDTAGPQALSGLLALCRAGRPPVVFSNGFPVDRWPLPCRLPVARPAREARKASRAVKYLDTARFTALLSGRPVDPGREGGGDFPVRSVFRNTMGRGTGTVLGEGGLHSLDQAYADGVAVYLRVERSFAGAVPNLLSLVGWRGVGGRKSIGLGGFDLADFAPYALPEPGAPDGFVSLSNYVPAPDDPVDGLYRLTVKYGRLDRELAVGAPFKKPLIQIVPGAVFRLPAGEPARPFYGTLVDEVAPAFPAAGQACFTLALPCRLDALYPVEGRIR